MSEYKNDTFNKYNFFFEEECLLLGVTHSSSSINMPTVFQFERQSCYSLKFQVIHMICVFRNAGNEMPASISQLQAALELDFG